MAEPPITRQASYCSRTRGSNGTITRVVLHDEEVPVSNNSAESVAAYFAGSTARGSAHYVIDADSEQHCVLEDTLAYHAPPNAGSIGIEHDGYARFGDADWQTPGSQATLRRSAARCADLCRRYDLPVVWLSVADLLAGHKGITSHANVTAAWHQSTHTDPGPHFPVGQYLDLVRQALGVAPIPVPTPTTGGTVSIECPILRRNDAVNGGPAVHNIQRILLPGKPSDGWFGAGTEEAVRVFQHDRGLLPDGVVGKSTYVALGYGT